jgi:hypothetical protein
MYLDETLSPDEVKEMDGADESQSRPVRGTGHGTENADSKVELEGTMYPAINEN